MLVLSTIDWLPAGAALTTSVTFRNAPGLPPDATWAPTLLPPLPAVNCVPAQLPSRKVESDTVCAPTGAASARPAAKASAASPDHGSRSVRRRFERFMAVPFAGGDALDGEKAVCAACTDPQGRSGRTPLGEAVKKQQHWCGNLRRL